MYYILMITPYLFLFEKKLRNLFIKTSQLKLYETFFSEFCHRMGFQTTSSKEESCYFTIDIRHRKNLKKCQLEMLHR